MHSHCFTELNVAGPRQQRTTLNPLSGFIYQDYALQKPHLLLMVTQEENSLWDGFDKIAQWFSGYLVYL